MQLTTSNIDSRPIFPYHVQNHARFVSPCIYFVYLTSNVDEGIRGNFIFFDFFYEEIVCKKSML